MTTTNQAKQARGFASMDPEKRRRICSKGGKAAHAKGRAHEWTRKEAIAAGRKGGNAPRKNPATHDFPPSTIDAANETAGTNDTVTGDE